MIPSWPQDSDLFLLLPGTGPAAWLKLFYVYMFSTRCWAPISAHKKQETDPQSAIDMDDAAKRYNSHNIPQGPNWQNSNPTNPAEGPGFSGWGIVRRPALFRSLWVEQLEVHDGATQGGHDGRRAGKECKDWFYQIICMIHDDSTTLHFFLVNQ